MEPSRSIFSARYGKDFLVLDLSSFDYAPYNLYRPSALVVEYTEPSYIPGSTLNQEQRVQLSQIEVGIRNTLATPLLINT